MVDAHDAKIIESIPLSQTHMVDRDGWNFTNNGRYTVKSGYQVERVYPDGEESLPLFQMSPLLKLFSGKSDAHRR